MITKSGFDKRKVDNARRLYTAMREINLAGGRALEAYERVALLTVPVGLRPFCLLTYIEETEYSIASAVLPKFGLHCGPIDVKFHYDLTVDAPQDLIDAYDAYENRSPLRGLGVAAGRIDFGSSDLGSALCYPRCCAEMDERTKAHDRSVALRSFIESKACDFAAVKAALASGETVPSCPTDMRDAWGRRFDQTRDLFPFAIHTACDGCLNSGSRSPTGLLSRRYAEMTKLVAPDLHNAVVRSREVFR